MVREILDLSAHLFSSAGPQAPKATRMSGAPAERFPLSGPGDCTQKMVTRHGGVA